MGDEVTQTAKAVDKTQAKVAATQETVAASTVRQEKSVKRQESSALRQEESADRRTELAADRTVLAAERTYAAWMRTGVAAMVSGVGAGALLKGLVPTWVAFATSVMLVLFAQFSFIAAVWREVDTGVPPPRPDVRKLPAWIMVGFSGFLVLVAGAVLVGLWTR
ncbi:YidH family protein [Sphingomonas jaspsi]|uniref:YidH family protein n=1 Tax=Sphingomonas jaspsi TaxID=392409 RepID=UPI0004B6EEA3|nr:DUF202 domain-containing protein [Sphingomonas jaspsi]